MGFSFTEVPIPQRHLSAGLFREERGCYCKGLVVVFRDVTAGRDKSWETTGNRRGRCVDGWRDQVCAGKLR